MEAAGKEILSGSMEKKFDLRGRQRNILRLLAFDNEAFIHMAFYRISVFASFIAGLLVALGLLTGIGAMDTIAFAAIAVMWVLFTPQLFETSKAFSVILSKGAVFGRLNESFLDAYVKERFVYKVYWAVPYLIMVVWALGFASFVYLVVI